MMSTRSGKRIHSSISENVDSVSEIEIKTERQTRSKSAKENGGEVSTNRKKNFVRRPSDDHFESSNDKTENTSKSGRNSRRFTLKELNVPEVDYEELNDRKSMRQHRRPRKENTVELTNVCVPETNERGKEKKKNKKKRAVIENFENESVEAGIITKKKTSKKKRQSNSFTVEENVTGDRNKSFNKSNVSIDSFHSAAGSPDNIKDDHFKNADKIGKNRGRKENSSLKFNNCVENVKDTKKRGKKTAKGKYFGTSINKSSKLSASNESFDSSGNKKEKIEDKDVNRFEKEISGTFKTNLKQKSCKERNFLSNIENTHTKAELHNSIEANIHGTDLKKKTIDKKNYIDTSTSNFDLINIPHVKGKGLESVSPLNNSSKKSRKSTSKNSTSDKIDGSITLLNDCNKDTVDNLMIVFETQLDDININHITGAEESRKIVSKDPIYEKINLSDRKLDQTFDKTENSFYKNSNADNDFSHYNRSSTRESSIKNTTYDKIEDNLVDITFNKEPSNNCNTDANSTATKSRISLALDIVSTVLNGTYEKITKDESSSFCNDTYDKPILDTTFVRTKDNIDGDNIINLNPKSSIISSDNTDNLTSDMFEDCSSASITSDDSRSENIINTTNLLIESSMDESQLNLASILLHKTATPQNEKPIGNIFTSDKQENSSDNTKTPLKREGTLTETKTTPFKREGTHIELRTIPAKHRPTLNPTTPLKREGTFIKESTEVMSPNQNSVDKTPPTRRKSTPSPGRTPFSTFRGGSKGRITLNVTHSIEKPQRLSSAAVAPRRPTRVMFRSPVDNPGAVVAQTKGKVIKSNLKGSMKSFMFDETASEQGGSRKRSRTQDCAYEGAKRARSVASGAGRKRTASAAGHTRLQAPVMAEATSPVSKSEAKPRTKLPDFAALHRKQFSKMESLDECQRRHARRARALLTPPPLITPTALNTPTTLPAPTASLTPMAPREALHRNNPKEASDTAQSQSATRLVTQKSKEIDKKNQSYTRFGFKLNLDVNPFSVPAKTAANLPKDVIKPKVLRRQATLPSLAGTTHRKEAAKQAVMREKSFTDKRDVNRNQNRTVIKGVRTNRRFELQMKMRNID